MKIFAFTAMIVSVIAFVLNAANAAVPHAVNNWGMLFIILFLISMELLVEYVWTVRRRA